MKAKKSLGQNFLTSSMVSTTMIHTGSVQKGDIIIEIGPGKGALTQKLLDAGATVLALEMDSELITYLHEKFTDAIHNDALVVFECDALEFEKNTAFQEKLSALTQNFTLPYKVVANIPYYITSAILRAYLTAEHQPSEMVLLMQKEVAHRIVMKDHKMSLLSLSVELFGAAKYIKKVPPHSFSPAPSIDSAILHIHTIGRNKLPKGKEAEFFKLLKHSFAHKRKTLSKNLRPHYDEKKLAQVFSELSINPKSRAEDIDLSTWLHIFAKL